MDPARWERIQALFHEVADWPPPEQDAILIERSGGDEDLIEAVRALLTADASQGTLLDRDVAELARDLFPDSTGALPRHRFGPYRITGILGEGGMGVVYLARRDDLGSLAAIKILRDASLSPSRRERFAAEQRTLAQLNHPGIAHLYDAGTLPDGTPWFVMEYVDGTQLTGYCADRIRSVPGRLELFRRVCEAVQHAHQHAVIHRDLKPSNILVRADGSVKLLDFGIAKQLESLDLAEEQTRTGLRLMTPAYAAPEQLRGERVGVHTDVYALGVILFELLAGRLPFDRSTRTRAEAVALLTEPAPERPSAVARRGGAGARYRPAEGHAWAELDVLCLTAMHPDPERRYRTVEALVRDIDHFLAGQPLEARPDNLRYRAGKFVRRNWRGVAVAGLGATLLLGLVVFYTVRLATARNAALAEAARTERIQQFMLNLFQGGDREAGPSDSLRVVTLVDRGVQGARALEDEPEIQAELYQTLGGLYLNLGQLARADTLLTLALERRRARLGPEHTDVARSLVALGRLRLKQASYDEAEQLTRHGLRIARRHLPGSREVVTDATASLGRVLEERGAYDQAIPVMIEALGLLDPRDSVSAGYASTLGDLANTHFLAGHYDTADSLHRRVLALSRRLYGDRHPNVAEDLADLGEIQQMLGHYVEAEGYFRQAEDIARSWYGRSHPVTASYLTMLGRSLLFQNKYDSASVALEEALAIQQRTFGPSHPKVAEALNELGSLAWQKDDMEQAERRFQRVLSIYRGAYGENHQFVGVAMANLAGVYQVRKDYPRAEALFRGAIAIYTTTLTPEHVNTGIGRIKLGRILLREGRFAEGARETRAGYDILIKQTAPATSFLQAARKDLAADYDSLGRPEEAARFRSELSDATSTAP
jgi:serine/threonine-protein kinase